MASTDPPLGQPSPTSSKSAAVLDLAREAEEVYRIGDWSVRKLPEGAEIGLVYLNEAAGIVEAQAPQAVLDALELDSEGGDLEPVESLGLEPEEAPAEKPESKDVEIEDGEEQSGENTNEAQDDTIPLFRRIILGAQTEVPLKMARDMLEAIKEDVSMFEQVQKRFSDAPDEQLLSLEDGLGEELEEFALSLEPGEVSDVLGTEAGAATARGSSKKPLGKPL